MFEMHTKESLILKEFEIEPFEFSIEPDKLNFAFWNTSLTPPVPKCVGNTSPEKMASALKIIDDILKEADFLGLCEVHTDNLTQIGDYLKDTKFEVVNLIRKVGQTWFDLGVVYNKDKLSVEFEQEIRARHGQQGSLKAGIHVNVTDLETKDTFNVFISHWKSRLSGNEEERKKSAIALRNSISELIEEDKSVILMGDYNDGPFNQSLFCELAAGKCFDAIKSYPQGILYNPFARLSLSSNLYSYLDEAPDSVGTYYIKGAKTEPQHFFTFDQIIFSANFLGLMNWHLEESSTLIFKHKLIEDRILKSKEKPFDHYPVISTIIKPIWS